MSSDQDSSRTRQTGLPEAARRDPAKTPLRCAICGESDARDLFRGLVKCNQCGFIWADLSIGSQELEKLYERNYFFGGEYRDYLEEKGPLEKDFRKNLDILSRFAKGGRLLEVGSAYGFFLNMARSRFSEVEGCEISPEAAQYAKSNYHLNIHQGDFLHANLPQLSFDAVVSWATLEHLPNPHLYLEKMTRLLRPGGIFACTTVDIGALVPRLRGSRWRQIHPPTHVSYFSKKTLFKLMGKYGLKPIHSEHVGSHRTVDNTLYTVLVLANRHERLYQWLKRLNLTRGSYYLNLFDTIYAVAVKPLNGDS